jgi:hypothetical protein
MIDVTSPFIGTGKLVRLSTPEQFADMVENSKLLKIHPLIILGARGDASMYPRDVSKFLEIMEESDKKVCFGCFVFG